MQQSVFSRSREISDAAVLPRLNTKCGQNSFVYREATMWNSLPNDFKLANTFPSFKMKLK